MLCVGGGRSDAGIGGGSPQAQRRMDRIVVGMNHVVSGARMLGILVEDLFDDGSGPHVIAKVPGPVGQGQDR